MIKEAILAVSPPTPAHVALASSFRPRLRRACTHAPHSPPQHPEPLKLLLTCICTFSSRNAMVLGEFMRYLVAADHRETRAGWLGSRRAHADCNVFTTAAKPSRSTFMRTTSSMASATRLSPPSSTVLSLRAPRRVSFRAPKVRPPQRSLQHMNRRVPATIGSRDSAYRLEYICGAL